MFDNIFFYERGNRNSFYTFIIYKHTGEDRKTQAEKAKKDAFKGKEKENFRKKKAVLRNGTERKKGNGTEKGKSRNFIPKRKEKKSNPSKREHAPPQKKQRKEKSATGKDDIYKKQHANDSSK